MNIVQGINRVKTHLEKNITYQDVANAFKLSRASIDKKVAARAELKSSEKKALAEYFNVPYDLFELENQSALEIKYYQNPKIQKLIENPLITSMWIDYELFVNVWRKKPNDIKIITMVGDKMQGKPSVQSIKNGDVMFIDTTMTDINNGGIYAYETLNGTKLAISHISVMLNGNIRFYYTNDIYEDEIRTPQELKELDFNVIGRVIKNASFLNE